MRELKQRGDELLVSLYLLSCVYMCVLAVREHSCEIILLRDFTTEVVKRH